MSDERDQTVGVRPATEAEDAGPDYDVPEDERLDEDGGEGSDASEGGLDDDLADVYGNPGPVWEGPA